MTYTEKRLESKERLKIIVGGYCYAQDGGNGGYEFGDIVKHIDESINQARAEGAIEERERITNIIDGTNCDMCGQENTMWNCLTDRMEVCNGAKHELLRNIKEK